MSIKLIDKIKPANNGSFPLVDAEDIEMPDGTRLSEFNPSESGGLSEQVQSDWNVTDDSSAAFIKNKPTIPTKTSELENDSGFSTSGGSSGAPIYYGTTNTAAATDVKVVTCAGFKLEAGAIINVYFSNVNTATTPLYLNVNSTGAKIVSHNGHPIINVAGGRNLICGYDIYTFRYNGYQYDLINIPNVASSSNDGLMSKADKVKLDGLGSSSGGTGANTNTGPPIYYGTTNTAAATDVKVVTCAGFKLEAGAIINVKFINANTAASILYLNINSTGPKMIMRDGGVISGADNNIIAAGNIYAFRYDGMYYDLIGVPSFASASAGGLMSKADKVKLDGLGSSSGSANIGNGTVTIYQGSDKKGSFTLNQTDDVDINLNDFKLTQSILFDGTVTLNETGAEGIYTNTVLSVFRFIEVTIAPTSSIGVGASAMFSLKSLETNLRRRIFLSSGSTEESVLCIFAGIESTSIVLYSPQNENSELKVVILGWL